MEVTPKPGSVGGAGNLFLRLRSGCTGRKALVHAKRGRTSGTEDQPSHALSLAPVPQLMLGKSADHGSLQRYRAGFVVSRRPTDVQVSPFKRQLAPLDGSAGLALLDFAKPHAEPERIGQRLVEDGLAEATGERLPLA